MVIPQTTDREASVARDMRRVRARMMPRAIAVACGLVVMLCAFATLSVVAASGVGVVFVVAQALRSVDSDRDSGEAGVPQAIERGSVASGNQADRQAVLLETITNLIERIDALEASRDSMVGAVAMGERAIRDLRWQMNAQAGTGGDLLPFDASEISPARDGFVDALPAEMDGAQR